MANIKPFKGLRYTEKAGELSSLCCPPYDIISEGERASYLDRNPQNIIRIELPTILSDSPEFDAYSTANLFLKDWLGKGLLSEDDSDSYYVYEMKFSHKGQEKSLKGLVAAVKAVPFSDGVVLPHEETLSKAKEDRYKLISAIKTNVSHIYSMFRDDGEVAAIIEKIATNDPIGSFKDGSDVTHTLWRSADTSVNYKLTSLFTDKKLYIADGHHRYETAVNYAANSGNAGASHVLMTLVPFDDAGLVVLPTHRIVKNVSFDYRDLIGKLSQNFEVTEYLNREKGEVALYNAEQNGDTAFTLFVGDNNYINLKLRNHDAVANALPNTSNAYRSLDVAVLHSLVLEPFFGINKDNMANGEHLAYTRSSDEALSEVDGKRAACAFLLNPTKVTQIGDVAAAGEKMPQKSTYFFPKLTTGIVMRRLGE
ncbi:MAG: DUF1015 domain-containing protein [Oscillospiraceae bacterium]|jgi:uncharacterized protein (DUF1015 family)|nr:DUF1015 domain-containing protein [Oscillospiraceae bacterium]